MLFVNRVREYIAEVQKELKLTEQRQPQQRSKVASLASPGPDKEANQMKAVMDRLESRKLVDILSQGWDSADNADLVSRLLANRIQFADEHEMPSERVEVLDDEDDDDEEEEEEEGEGRGDGTGKSRSLAGMERDSPYESLYEHMVDDMSVLYEEEVARMGGGGGEAMQQPGDNFSERIMTMMEEKYQLRAVEQAMRDANKYGEQLTHMFCVILHCIVLYCIVLKTLSVT